MSKGLKRKLSISLFSVLIVVCLICCLSACTEKTEIKAYVDEQLVSFSNISEMLSLIPTKTGYSFDGWAYFDNGELINFTQDSIPDENASVVYYPTWKIKDYTATFYADGNVVGTELYTVENNPTMPEIPEKSGYNGAWEEHDFTTGGDVSINAVYTPKTYNIAYENLCGAPSNNATSYTYGNEYTLVRPERSGYTFNGWFDREGNKVEKIEKDDFGDLILCANWVATPYTLYLNNTKDADLGGIPTEYTVETGGFSLPSISTPGYTFDGWYNDGEKIDKIKSGTIGNKILEAHWTPIVYNITYINTKDASNRNPSEYTTDSEEIRLKALSADGYSFEGWYDGETKVVSIPKNTTGDITLEARWSLVVYYLIYTNTKGAENTNPTEYTIQSSGFDLVPIQAEGYNFEGWYNEDRKIEYISPDFSFGMRLEARWTPVEYTITYYNVEGAINDNPTTYTIEDRDFNLVPAVKPWFNFWRWCTDASLNDAVKEIDVSSAKDIVLYADWELVNYTANYYIEDKLVSIQSFNAEKCELTDPAIPEKFGYIGSWDYTLEPRTLNIYAKYTPIAYKISYLDVKDAVNENNVSYTIDSSTFELKPITANGYNFLGWYEGEQLVTEIANGSYGNMELTARWAPIVYSIEYENLKDAEVQGLVYSYTIESEIITLPSELSAFGYTFGGWKNENGEKIDSIEKGSFGNRVITADFTPIVYTITYEEVGEAINSNELTYTIESGLVLKPLSRFGFDFLGWYSGNDLVTEIQVGEYGNRTLTAKWDIATYQITYNNTKDADISSFVSEYTIESQTIELPLSLSVEGYVFNGWKDANGERIEAINQGSFGNVEVTADLTPIVYNIVYKNTSEAINLNPQRYNIEDSIELAPLQRRGYSFVGWYKGAELVSSIEVGTVGNITLTAKWELAVYTITYTGTFGADTSNFVSSYTIESDLIKLPMDLKVSGYTFNGWKNESGSIVTEIRKGSYGNIVLTADLHPTKYVITLEAMDGSVNKTSITVLYGQDFTLPVPTYANGTFLGWYNNTGDDATPMTDANGNSINAYPYRSSRTFYAHYFVEVFTITFDTDGGTAIPAQKYSCGSLFDESAAITERGNDLFEGWYDSFGERFLDGTPITTSYTLKAKWANSIGISDYEGLLAISENPTGNYHLLNDINLKGNLWTPIENFSGVFDGKGYTLKNFFMSCTSYLPKFAFINVNDGTIRNLCFGDFTYNVNLGELKDFVGSLFVAENNGTVENCVVDSGLIKLNFIMDSDGYKTTNKKFGTFVGENGENATIKNCRSTLDITITGKTTNSNGSGYDNTDKQNIICGGIVGNNRAVIENCSYEAAIHISTYSAGNMAYYCAHRAHNILYFGGIVGNNESVGVCRNSYTNAELTSTSSTGSYGANYPYMGGIVGVNYGEIISCRSAGTINDVEDLDLNHYVGGLVGQNLDKAKITSCYSATNITATKNANIGGFVGNNEGIIQNSFAKGAVTSSAGGNVAGFVSINGASGSISKCYSNGNVSATSGNVGYFVASSSGTLFKCFYLSSSTLMLNGEPREYLTEYETVNGLLNQVLWSKEFLVDEMYWEEKGWIILTNENPVLNWEISIDDYDVTVIEPDCENMGYSLYVEKEGNRFFIRNYVAAWGHSYDNYDVKVVEPTCVTRGYEEYTCIICGHVERMNYTDATGHTVGNEIEHKDPTCEEVGYTIHSCAVCGVELRTEMPALGHTPVVTVERTNPVCGKTESGEFIEEDGLTERIECSVCNVVLQEQSVIKPHDYVLTATTTEPTCTENGLGTYTCRYENCGKTIEQEIPALGHTDVNGDHRCDTCKVLLGYEGETVIEIKTAADLLNISSNLNGVYKLMNDIDMKNTAWTSIGTAAQPFTGYFDGNGKAIKNLCGADQTFVPMFGYMSGIVHGLTLNYESGVTVNVSENGKAGLLAEVNVGSIVSCNIVGVVNVNFSYISSSETFADTNQTATAIFGGIVYTNGSEGVILNSTVSANFKVSYSHKYTLNTDWSVNILLNRNYRYHHTSVYNVYFGAIAGINSGEIQSCSVNGKLEYGAGSEGAATAKVKDCNGHVFVTTNVYLESFVAINNMTVENCATTLNPTGTLPKNAVRYFAKFWTEEETFNLTIDGKKYSNE